MNLYHIVREPAVYNAIIPYFTVLPICGKNAASEAITRPKTVVSSFYGTIPEKAQNRNKNPRRSAGVINAFIMILWLRYSP